VVTLGGGLDRLAGGGPERVRRRRWLDLILLALAVLLVGVVGLVAAAVGSTERITAMWVGAVVSDDGSARITELIDWDYGVHARHGIFRDVPGLAVDAPVTVSSGTAPAGDEVYPAGSETEIRIGDPDRTIKGRHRYRIRYPLADVAAEGLAWDAVAVIGRRERPSRRSEGGRQCPQPRSMVLTSPTSNKGSASPCCSYTAVSATTAPGISR
jgi:hypothetical protein